MIIIERLVINFMTVSFPLSYLFLLHDTKHIRVRLLKQKTRKEKK